MVEYKKSTYSCDKEDNNKAINNEVRKRNSPKIARRLNALNLDSNTMESVGLRLKESLGRQQNPNLIKSPTETTSARDLPSSSQDCSSTKRSQVSKMIWKGEQPASSSLPLLRIPAARP